MPVVPPYNPETGVWTIFGDPRPAPSARGSNQSAVVSMAPTRPEALTTQAVLTGDIKEASKFIPLAQQQMQVMHQTNVNNLEIYSRPVDLGGGRRMNLQRNFTSDVANIHVPGGTGSRGPFNLNFDASAVTDYVPGYMPNKFFEHPIYYPHNMAHHYSNHSGDIDGLDLQFSRFGSSSFSSFGVSCSAEGYYVEDQPMKDFVYKGNHGNLFSSASLEPSKTIGLVYEIGPGDGYSDIGKGYSWPHGVSHIDIVKGTAGNYLSTLSYYSDSVKDSGIIVLRYVFDGYIADPIQTQVRFVEHAYIDGVKVGEDSFNAYYSTYESACSSRIQCCAIAREESDGNYVQSSSFASCPQYFVYDNDIPEDDVQRVTDKLAAKWGF